MKKLWFVLVLVLMLTGCKITQDIRMDTIVDIPLHPTEPVTQASTEETATDPAAETASEIQTIPREAPTEKSGRTESGSGKGTGGKTEKPTAGNTEKPTEGKTESPAAPPATQPPTDPPTQPPTQAPTEPVDQASSGFDPGSFSPGALEYGIISEVNARRAEAGLDQLAADTALCRLAALRAWELTGNWSHSRPDGSDFRTVFSQYGYPCSGSAENIYYGVFGAGAIVEKWMSDPEYSSRLLLEAAAIGAGSYTADNGLTYVAVLIVW